MTKWRAATVVLALPPLASNLWWFMGMADMAVTCKYHEQMLYERAEVIKDFVAVTPGLTSGRGRADVIAVAKQAIGEEGFVKEGATWVGWLGFVFDGNELAQVRPSWSHGGKEPAL